MGTLLFLLVTAVMLVGAHAVAIRWFDRPALSWLAALLLVPVEVFALTLLVGALLRTYETWAMAVTGLVVGIGSWVLGRRMGRAAEYRARRPAEEPDPRGYAIASWVLAGLVVAALAWRTLITLVLPQNAYDALAYHLPMIGEWVRTGRVFPTPLTEALCCGWYPVAGEAWAGWSAVFVHGDRLVGTGQLWFAAVIWAAASVLAGTLGASRATRRTAGALVAGMPIVLAQADVAYVDLTYAGALLAAYALVATTVTAASDDVARRAALLCGVAIGFAAAVKGTGIVGGGICALALVAALVWRFRGRALRTIGGAAVLAAALALPWYLVAWNQTGNPIEPYELSVGDTVVFEGSQSYRQLTPPPGFIDRLARPAQPVRSWVEDLRIATPGFRYGADVRAGGFGPLFILGILPAMVIVLLAVRGPEQRSHRLALGFVVGAALITLAIQPYAWWTRFTIAVGAVGMVLIAVALGRLPARLRTALLVLMIPVVALGAARVGTGSSEVNRTFGRGEIVRNAPAWLLDRPDITEAMPSRFAALTDLGDGPVLVDRSVNNRVPSVAMGHDFEREVVLRRLDTSRALQSARELDATTLVLHPTLVDRAGNRSELERAGAVRTGHELLVIGPLDG